MRIKQTLSNQIKSNPTKLLGDLIFVINFLKTKVIPPDSQINILEDDFELYIKRNLYLGYEFESHLKNKKNDIDNIAEMSIRQHCTDFVVELISQLKHRLPDNFEILKRIDAFSVQNILRANKDPIIQILVLFEVNAEEIEKIVSQYNTVHLVQWKNQEDTVSFWTEVNKHMDSAGNKQFEHLSLFAMNLLSLPWSNAEVERVFSQVNLVKTTLRNRLHIDTLNSILAVRFGLRRSVTCCQNDKLPDKYLSIIGTNIYETDFENETLDSVLYNLNENI